KHVPGCTMGYFKDILLPFVLFPATVFSRNTFIYNYLQQQISSIVHGVACHQPGKSGRSHGIPVVPENSSRF
ncbi:MAG: hypothetical protein KAV00_08490, partial [Phycisphaerae bacterium]|nr:hypothetical protein [Phycisphaerae bacterium]